MAQLIKPDVPSSSAEAKTVGGEGTGLKAVILTADDFGLSCEVNAGVLRAHRDGVLTGASLMVAEGASAEAAAIARATPSLDVGLHLVVCRGIAAARSTQMAGIADAAGAFGRNPTLVGLRYFFNRRLRSFLRDEIRAQIERHLELVGYLNHLDGHLNFHVHPTIADLQIELALEYRIRCIRLPREAVLTTLVLAPDHAPRKLFEAAIFRILARRTRRMIERHGLRSTDWLFGLHQSGHLSEDYIRALLGRLRPGTTEIYFHPAADDGELPQSRAARTDLAILTSPRIREVLAAFGVRRTNFAEIARIPG